MPHFSFLANQHFRWKKSVYKVLAIEDETRILIKHEDGGISEVSLDELKIALNSGDLAFVTPNLSTPSLPPRPDGTRRVERTLNQYSESTQRATRRAWNYVTELRAKLGSIHIDSAGVLKSTIVEVAKLLNDPEPPSVWTVHRWSTRHLRSGGDRSALIYRFELRGGKNRRRCPIRVQELEDQLIEKIYLTPAQNPVVDVADALNYQLKQESSWGDVPPQTSRSQASITRQIRRLEKPMVVAARQGASYAKRLYRSDDRTPDLTFPLERVEIDHTPLDLAILDPKTGLSLGRPTVSMGICQMTKMPWGLHVSFDDTSTDSVMRCIAHGIKPKAYIHEQDWGIESEWPVFGIPGTIRCDNGSEFHSSSLKKLSHALGFHLEFSPRHQPNWKGSIERFFRTLNYDFTHKLPGTSRAKYWQRTEEDHKASSVCDLETFNKLLHTWLVDVYMLREHRTLRMSPLQAWKEAQ